MIIIFNGPPGSGKDEAAEFFSAYGFKHVSFKYQLFKETIEHFGVSFDWFMEGYKVRSIKERKEEQLQGLSRREALIHVSEDIIKVKKGLDYFGVCVASEIEDGKDYAISDGGFAEELTPIINRIGTDNIVLVQLTRNGCDFSADSRRYFDGNLVEEHVLDYETPIDKKYVIPQKFPIKTYRIHNNSHLVSFRGALQKIYKKEKVLDGTEEKGKASQPYTF